jgi:hypothetical protein
MKHKHFSVLMILALLVGLLGSASLVGAAPPPPDYKPVDVGPELREWELTSDRIVGEPPIEMLAPSGSGSSVSATAIVGEVKTWMALDNYCGYYYFKDYELRAVGDQAEVWVAVDLGWTIPPGTPICELKPTDPRPVPVVTDEQVNYLLSEFDTNIHPTETAFFGPSDEHTGEYSLLEAWGYVPPGYYDGDKLAILVDNVRDDNYYNNFPLYIAGFYSPSFEGYFDRNVMSIDAYDWENRTGPDSARPYLYEGVFAHEYQHLLHDDYDSDEENFINEGMSMFAEYLTGYAVSEAQYEDFLEMPENSLVVWGDQGDDEILADYSNTYLFQYFLMEQYGTGFIQELFMNPENGISGVNSTLGGYPGQRKDFGDIYHDFASAVLIDSKQANYRNGFETLDLMIDIGTVDVPNPEAYDTPGAPPWGTDYIWIDGGEELGKFKFNGYDFTVYPTGWTSDGDVLYGGYGDLLDNWAIFEATGGGTLSFDTYWDIEDYWDFGFVQVSTDGGSTWTSLENPYTTYLHDPDGHPDILANLPGLTGWSGAWLNVEYDLSAYSGDILLAFRYMTDWAFTYEGWYIDNVYVDGTLISDGSSTAPFKDISELFPVENDFTVSFVGIKEKSKGMEYKVHTMKLSDLAEEGLFELNKVLKWSDSAVMLVTFDAPEGFTGYAMYDYEFTYSNAGPKK